MSSRRPNAAQRARCKKECGRTCRTISGICWPCQYAAAHGIASAQFDLGLHGGQWIVRKGIQVWVPDEVAA